MSLTNAPAVTDKTLWVKPIDEASAVVGKVIFNSAPSIFVNMNLVTATFEVTSTLAALIAAFACNVLNNEVDDTESKAVPVPVPTPVALNTVLALLSAEPINVKSVVPGTLIL